jgi:DNA recombination protein RmuC
MKITQLQVLIFFFDLIISTIFIWIFTRKKVIDRENEAIVTKERLESREHEIEKLEASIQLLTDDLDAKNLQIHDLEQELVGKKITIAEMEVRQSEQQKRFAEQLALLDGAREQLKTEFQNLANQILDEKSHKFTTQNKENIDGILLPLREQLKEFKGKVEEVYIRETEGRAALVNELSHLKALNQQVSQDTVNLTLALKGDPKTQGNWGELTLERVLETSGLEKGREYETQFGVHDKDGNLFILDALIYLPQQKNVVVDSKVSLTAYEKFCSTEKSEDKVNALKEHLQSIRGHIKGLSAKQYEEVVEIKSLDFVLLFIPIEAAFVAAIKEDKTLFNEAFRQNIILTCPSTLLATLRIIANTWRVEYQNRNALEIARKAGDLFDKFCGFLNTFQELGESLKKSTERYDSAISMLSIGRGNLIKRAAELQTLGIKGKKTIPQPLLELSEESDPDTFKHSSGTDNFETHSEGSRQ